MLISIQIEIFLDEDRVLLVAVNKYHCKNSLSVVLPFSKVSLKESIREKKAKYRSSKYTSVEQITKWYEWYTRDPNSVIIKNGTTKNTFYTEWRKTD